MGAQAVATVTDPVTLLGQLPAGAQLARRGSLRLAWPTGFDFDRTVRSHGWCGLAPSAYDRERAEFHRTLALPDAGPLTVTVAADGQVSWGRTRGTTADRAAIRRQLRHMLCLDDDLSALHEACRELPAAAWVVGAGAGRLLRSPTAWEDLARTLATTNCSWALTRQLTTRLVATLGVTGPAGERAFPTPEAVLAAGVGHLREVVRAGYRSASFVELARTAAAGVPDGWWDPARSDAEVRGEVLALRGFGPYAADGMLGLLGRPRGLALDSWVRAKLPRLLGREAMEDDAIGARYAALGRWAGSVLWLELTRDWFEPSGQAEGGSRPAG